MSTISPDAPSEPRLAVSSGLGRDAVLVSVCTLVSRVTGFVRVVFLVVAGALIVKLGHDVWVETLSPLLSPRE